MECVLALLVKHAQEDLKNVKVSLSDMRLYCR